MNKPEIVIVGGGFSGTYFATELIENLAGPAGITIVETEEDRMYGGIAYSHATADAFHETNIDAKRIGVAAGYAAYSKELGRMVGARPYNPVSRQLVGEWLKDQLDGALRRAEFRHISLSQVFGEAVDITNDGHDIEVRLTDGRTLNADFAVLATGNNELRELPVITAAQKQDPAFAARYVPDQWSREGKEKIRSIPANEPVLIIGTGLSAYDAARTLLRQGHTGKIAMVSRHGLEHFRYPQSQLFDDIKLDIPEFVFHLDNPKRAVRKLVKEFRFLTGLSVDPYKGTVKPANAFYRRHISKNYLPEQVLKAWESHLVPLINTIGAETFGKILRRHSSLINVLRIGAGYDVYEEIKAAKERGQIEVIAASIERLDLTGPSIRADLAMTKSGKREGRSFHTVISSLGANRDYARTASPLWRNIIGHGYTRPHPTGIGVELNPHAEGMLAGNLSIFAVGPPAAGHIMTTEGIIGPPLFSIPGTRGHTARTAREVASRTAYEALNKKHELESSGMPPRASLNQHPG